MYRVINASTGELVAMCSRKEDAEVYLTTKLDDAQYVIEEDRFKKKVVDKSAE